MTFDFSSEEARSLLKDPIKFKKICWPHITFYDKQLEIVYSLRDNDETIVPAGNMLGKDFISAFCALWFFLSRSPCKVLTTSVDYTQLKSVLWGEIRRFTQTSAVTLPILENDLLIRQVINGQIEPRSFLIGRVADRGEGMLGQHLERGPNNEASTLALFDEASAIDNDNKEATETWSHKSLVIGNCYPCTNFFYSGVRGGRSVSKDGARVYKNIIKIKGEDSPNVKLGLKEVEAGLPPSHTQLIPGVLSYAEYMKRRETWPEIRQCIGLDAEFYEGAEFKLCPTQWMDRAEMIAKCLPLGWNMTGLALGIDPGEGEANTSWCVTNNFGVAHMRSEKTRDPSDISGITIDILREYKIPPEKALFDRGGGGLQIAGFMRKAGWNVQTVGFGEMPTDTAEEKRVKTKKDRKERVEHRYVYKNKRAEMYGMLREMIDPVLNPNGFAIDRKYTELHRQLRLIPLQFDAEGRMYLPPKSKKNKDSKEVTLIEILGCSPDESDACALSVHSLTKKMKQQTAGAI